ncbi:MAG: glycoside hydrolase N-terminal domain-containing protein, partial [Bacteroidota bacterium]|nr:glycoside hydrolase N-terminal domain-containing protein [Bacteroidota bacterium]
MTKNIFALLFFTFLFMAFGSDAQSVENFSSYERAKKHSLIFDGPAPGFFQGALLGNGGMGVVVTTRPDAIVLRFGHNNVWDIRLAENHRKEIDSFNFVFDKISKIPDTLALLTEDPWYAEYSRMAADNYRKPYPRPFPCGSMVLGFDRRDAEMIGYKLDISKGLCEVKLLTADRKEVILQIFAEMQDDRLWMQLVDSKGNRQTNIFNRIKIIPDPSTPPEFPKFTTQEDLSKGILSFRQVMPYQEPDQYDTSKGFPKDKAFRLAVVTNSALDKRSRLNWDGNEEKMGSLECGFLPGNGFIACVSLQQGLNTSVPIRFLPAVNPSSQNFEGSLEKNIVTWKAYWNKSGVALSDDFLEQIWYRNLYFFNCAAKDGATCPGLFANWSYNKIGTAWHGDYHMNYNIQQPFWATFSSNHIEKNLPYVNLIDSLMDVSEKWAKEYYGLPGAYFPHSSYPVKMTMNPYPVPTWGWEICETPWAVQGLWWHYLYSGDKKFLENRAYSPIKEAVRFLVAYMKRPDARSGNRWKDDKYHI